VPADALALALGAAALHALWNLLLAGARDVEAATAAALPVAVIAFAPAAAATWRVEGAALPFILGSSALELVYFALLAAAYRRADLSVVYPLTRGLAPVLVLVFGLLFLGLGASWGEAVGVGLVGVGVVLVRGQRGVIGAVELALVLCIAACIAGYTLVDRYGVRHAATIPYLELVLLPGAILYPAVIGLRRVRDAVGVRSVAAALAMFGGYVLVLAALRLARAASVAAVRESSVVIAVGLARLVLREPVGWPPLAGAVLVAAGVATIALS
jgi:drug/metabolite transporter (DMT)-like permease